MPVIDTNNYNVCRCANCNKILLEAVFVGTIKKVCERCKSISIFVVESQPTNAMQSFIEINEKTVTNRYNTTH